MSLGNRDGDDPEDKSQTIAVSFMLAVIKEHPMASDLPNEMQIDIATEALTLGKGSDKAWLESKISQVRAVLNQSNAPLTAAPTSGDVEEKKEASYGVSVSPFIEIDNKPQLEVVLQDHQKWIKDVLDPKATSSSGRAKIANSNLSGYDLTGVDLRGAIITDCNFRGAILKSANLSAADISHSDFSQSDLSGTNLRKAILKDCHFENTTMDNTDLRFAETSNDSFTPEQLSTTRQPR